VTEVLDLKNHMDKKQQKQQIAAYDAMAKSVDGMPIGMILNVMIAFIAQLIKDMSADERMRLASAFYQVIVTPVKKKEIIQ
jgi:hypothetical protein